MGNTFVNVSKYYQGKLKESTAVGAELIGDDSIDADLEIISMVIDCMKNAGLEEFQVEIGNVLFFKGLLKEAGIDGDEAEMLVRLIEQKNYFGVEEMVEGMHLNDTLKKLFSLLGSFETQVEELAEAKSLASDYPNILSAITDLEKLGSFLRLYGIEKYVSFELGIISNYHYYTGIIFSGYTFGSGEPIVKGGRYDRLLTYYGKDSASIGFAVVVDQLMAALSRQKIVIPVLGNGALIVYTKAFRNEAITEAKARRKKGIPVELILKDDTKTHADYKAYAKRNRIAELTFLEEDT